MQLKKQQLELDMKQQTGSKLGKEYIKVVYCNPVYLTYMQSAVLCQGKQPHLKADGGWDTNSPPSAPLGG